MREEYVYESPPLPPDEDVYSEKIPAAVELLISYLEVAGLSTDDLFGGDPTVRCALHGRAAAAAFFTAAALLLLAHRRQRLRRRHTSAAGLRGRRLIAPTRAACRELNDVIGSLSSGRTRDVAAVCRGSAQLAAASLAAYIRSLPEPLVGPPHYEALCAAVDIEPYGERVASVRPLDAEIDPSVPASTEKDTHLAPRWLCGWRCAGPTARSCAHTPTRVSSRCKVRDTLGGMPESTQTVLHRLFRFLSTLASRSAARGNSAEALAQVSPPPTTTPATTTSAAAAAAAAAATTTTHTTTTTTTNHTIRRCHP